MESKTKINQEGRASIPANIRKAAGIEYGEELKIEFFNDSIILTKVEKCCMLCKGNGNLIEVENILICKKCLDKLKTNRRVLSNE